MIGSLQQNLRRGAYRINRVAAENVTYSRSGNNINLRMRPTDATYASNSKSGFVEEWTGKNWVVVPEEWQRSGLAAPARGDTIQRITANGIETYELVVPPGMKIYDYTTYGEYLLIHSQLVPTT